MLLAHTYRTTPGGWGTAGGPYWAFWERVVGIRSPSGGLARSFFEGRLEVLEGQFRAGWVVAEGVRRWCTTGGILSLFHAPFRSYGGTTVSDDDGEDDVRWDDGGREEHRELALADGTRVLVREIRAGDALALQRLVGRLSEQTVYLRFFGPMRELSDRKARHFAEVDGQDRYALVALEPGNEEEIVAVVRYDKEEGTNRAEYAALVEDRFQGRGLGLALTRGLIEAARERGIRDFEALVLPENRGMLRLLRSLGLPERSRREEGVRRVSVDLFPEQRHTENG